MTGYLKTCAAAAGLGLLACAAFNLFMDPFEVFLLAEIPGINASKYGDGGRKVKALALRYPHYEGIILGTSRAQVGLRPDHESFRGMPVYNAGLPASSMWEQRYALAYAARRQPLKLAIVTLDFHAFGQKAKYRRGWAESGFNPKRGDPVGLSHLLVSRAAIALSLDTLLRNLRHEPPVLQRGHMLTLERVAMKAARQGQAPAFARYLPPFADEPGKSRDPGTFDKSMRQLEQILATCESRGIEVILIITPVHAYWWESRYRKGRGPLIDDWKRALVQTVYSPHRKRIAPLWDFSGYAGLVAEAVPAPGDLATQMAWFWEPSHYRSQLGDLILDRVLDHHEHGREVPAEFGVVLTPDNLEGRLAQFWSERERFVRERQSEIAALERVAAERRER